FTTPKWRRNALVGLGLAVAGQIGLWGVGFYTPELIDSAIPTIENKMRPKVETIMNSQSPEAHAAAISALDAKEKQKYLELISRVSVGEGKVEAAQVLGVPLNLAHKEK